jgi:very-short-patch-repair endonuclease
VRDRQRHFPNANARAKRLRRELTPAEVRLWNLLRELEGFHFCKQAPIGPFVFDFADKGRKLLIELDGGIHDLPDVMERDRIKDAWARGQSFVVLRIPNSYVFGTGEPAIAMVMDAARSQPDPREPWRRERRGRVVDADNIAGLRRRRRRAAQREIVEER